MSALSVSVCIPTYNQAPYLSETVQSILNQSRQVHEIIISDDASSDDTPALCAELRRRIPHLRYHRQPVNLGIAGNTDFVLRQAGGDLVVRVDSDDRLLPEYVARLAAALEAAPSAGYAHGAVWEIDHLGKRRHVRRLFRPAGIQPADEALRAALSGYRVAANILMFRRIALVAMNYTTGRPDYVEDYHLSVALAKAGWANVYCEETLAEYRVWMDAKQTRAKRKLQEIHGLCRTFDEQLLPGFMERGWSIQPLMSARKKIAARHAPALSDGHYTMAERAGLIEALVKLGNGWPLRWRLCLVKLGAGKVVVFQQAVINEARVKVKNMLATIATWRRK